MEGTLLEIKHSRKKIIRTTIQVLARFIIVLEIGQRFIYVTILHKNTQNIPKVFLEDIFHIWISLNKESILSFGNGSVYQILSWLIRVLVRHIAIQT